MDYFVTILISIATVYAKPVPAVKTDVAALGKSPQTPFTWRPTAIFRDCHCRRETGESAPKQANSAKPGHNFAPQECNIKQPIL
jgi:hypothetical protein